MLTKIYGNSPLSSNNFNNAKTQKTQAFCGKLTLSYIDATRKRPKFGKLLSKILNRLIAKEGMTVHLNTKCEDGSLATIKFNDEFNPKVEKLLPKWKKRWIKVGFEK